MTYHVIIPCEPKLHETAATLLQETGNGNAASQTDALTYIATEFYNLVINAYAGEQFRLAKTNKTISETAIKLFSATSKQLISFFVPRLKEKDIINLSQYIKDRMIIIEEKSYIGWPAPDNAYETLSQLAEDMNQDHLNESDIEKARQTYLDYQIDASVYLNKVLFEPGEIITLGPINKRLVAAGKKASLNGARTAIKRAVSNGNQEQLKIILDFQLRHLEKI